MLIYLPIPIQSIPRRPLKPSPCLPRHPGDPLQLPPDQDHVLRRLPDPKNLQPNLPKQNPAMESERREDQFIVFDSMKGAKRIDEGDIITEKSQ